MNNILHAFLLTLIAGLSTGIGSLIAFFAKGNNKRFLAVSLGFSAGVMIYVSMVEILSEANESLTVVLGEKMGSWITVIAFFGGMLLIAIIDKLVPSAHNPHEVKNPVEEGVVLQRESNDTVEVSEKSAMMRIGILTALAIAIHNFPEGLATFVSAMQDPSIAIPIVVAIAIHNIPEGIAVSVPIYYATGDKKKAFLYSFASGLAEPLGALFGYLLIMPFMNDTIFGILFAAVAGIMVFISFDELLPAAREYGEHHLSIYGLIAGMAVMAISLLLFI